MSCRRNSSLPQSYNDVLLYFPLEVSKYLYPFHKLMKPLLSRWPWPPCCQMQWSILCLHPVACSRCLLNSRNPFSPWLLGYRSFWVVPLPHRLLCPCVLWESSSCVTVEVFWASLLCSLSSSDFVALDVYTLMTAKIYSFFVASPLIPVLFNCLLDTEQACQT